MIELPILPTSLVGSYAQPTWLIDRERLEQREYGELVVIPGLVFEISRGKVLTS